MRKSNQRITKIKKDLIEELLERAEAIPVEDGTVAQPAGAELLERPTKGHYRNYVRDNFLKGINGIIQVGEGLTCPANDNFGNSHLQLATYPTRNDTFTAILDGLVFITRRYKAAKTNQISDPNPELGNQIVGKPLLQLPNTTYRNITALTQNSPRDSALNFLSSTAGFVPITLVTNPEMEYYNSLNISYSPFKFGYVENFGADTDYPVKINATICKCGIDTDSFPGTLWPGAFRALWYYNFGVSDAWYVNEATYKFTALLSQPVVIDNFYMMNKKVLNIKHAWYNRQDGIGRCRYVCRDDCVLCTPVLDPEIGPECPKHPGWDNYFTPIDFYVDGMTHEPIMLRFGRPAETITTGDPCP